MANRARTLVAGGMLAFLSATGAIARAPVLVPRRKLSTPLILLSWPVVNANRSQPSLQSILVCVTLHLERSLIPR